MDKKKISRKNRSRYVVTPKACRFCKEGDDLIDYKNVELIKNYINKRGKISARKTTGLCAKHQRKIAVEIKRARYLGLVPYVVYIYR